jgi:hypothetical protein
VRVGVLRPGALSLSLLLLAVVQAHAQAPPPAAPPPAQAPPAEIGFVSSYEIMKTVRTAGFSPLAPPLREGTSYVLRATDFRGILMRVVVDARTGVIRDANRIVPGPGRFGQMGSMVPPYDDPDFDAPALGANMAQPLRPPGARSATWPTLSVPLPRPRPAALAVQTDGRRQCRFFRTAAVRSEARNQSRRQHSHPRQCRVGRYTGRPDQFRGHSKRAAGDARCTEKNSGRYPAAKRLTFFQRRANA